MTLIDDRRTHPGPGATPQTGGDQEVVAVCEECGRCDETLRHSSHPFVVSFASVVKADRRITSGLFCERCRAGKATVATTKSLLAGWWSLTGPFATVGAVIENLRGGTGNAAWNAELQRSLGMWLHATGDFERAARCLHAAQSLRPTTETGRVLYSLSRSGYKGERTSTMWALLPLVPAAVFLLIVAVAFGLVRESLRGGSAAADLTPQALAKSREAGGMHGEVPIPEYPHFRSALRITDLRDAQALAERGASVISALQPYVDSARKPNDKVLREYTMARVLVIFGDVDSSVRAGRTLDSATSSLDELRNDPKLAPLFRDGNVEHWVTELKQTVTQVNSVYRGGASADAIERTVRESAGMTLDMVFANQGQDERGGVTIAPELVAQVDRRGASIDMALDSLRLRAQVLKKVLDSVNACLTSLQS